MVSWTKCIWSGTGSTLQCSEHFCSVQSDICSTLPGSHCDRSKFNLHSHFSFTGLCVWLLAAAASPGHLQVLDAKLSPLLSSHHIYICILSLSLSPNTLIFLLKNASVVIKSASETWSSPGSNIINLRVLFFREIDARLHEV